MKMDNMNTELISLTLLLVSIIGTPGPNNTILAISGVQHGYIKTLPLLISVNLGVVSVITLSAIGASSIQEQVNAYSEVLATIGALVLVYIGISSWPRQHNKRNETKRTSPILLAFMQLVNPKIWVIAMSIITTFSTSLPLVAICFLTLVCGLIFNSLWVFSGMVAGRKFHQLSSVNVSKIGAIAIAGIGLKILLDV